MNIQDKMLTCVDCGKEFVFTVGEQKFFESKGFKTEPKRCHGCKQAKKELYKEIRDNYAAPVVINAKQL